MDIFLGHTMIVIPWYLVLVLGSLVLGVLVAVGVLFAVVLGRTRRRSG